MIGNSNDQNGPRIHRLAAALISGALLSKVLGFAREVFMAQVLGASLVADSFRGAITAVMIPLAFLQNEGVPAILIPMQQEARARGNCAQRLAAVSIALTGISLALMLVLQALGEWWVGAVVGGFSSEGQALSLEFVRVMALGMPASTLLNCLAAGDIALGRSRLTNVRASLLNIAMLVGIALVALTGWIISLAWAFMIAFNALGIWAAWLFWREGNLTLAGMSPSMIVKEGAEFLRRLFPFFALPLAEQGHIWVERALASSLATGAIASLDYARTLTESTLPLISQPLGLAVLSTSRTINVRAQIDAIALPLLVLAPPVAAFLFVFAPEVIRLVFQRGAFSEAAVEMTSQALRGISVGLWAATLGWILLRILNNAGRNVLAVAIVASAFAMNVVFNLIAFHLPWSEGPSLMTLGLGEAVRGFVLLAGIAFALEYRGRLMLQIFLGLIPAAMMVAVGWQIREVFVGTLERLFVGGIGCAACMALAVVILVPISGYGGFSRIRGWLAPLRKT